VLSTILFLLATAAYLTTTTTKTRDASPTHLIGPLVLTASVLSYDRVLLSWNAIPTASLFHVWWMRHPSQRFEAYTVLEELSHKVMVRPSTTYTFKVNTWLPSGVWIESNNVTVTTPDTPSTSDGWPAPTLELTADAVLTVRWLPLSEELEQQAAASLPPGHLPKYTALWRRSNDADSMQWLFLGVLAHGDISYDLRNVILPRNATYDIRVAYAYGTPTEVLSPIATITIPAHRS